MPYIIKRTITPGNASTAAIAALQTTAGAGSFTLTAGAASLDYARQVALTSAGNISAVNFTIVGTDADGNSISETRAGPNANTVRTTAAFKTVTAITVDAAVGTNTSAGYDGSGVIKDATMPVDYRNTTAPEVAVIVTGTVNFTVSECYDAILKDGTSSATFFSVTALASKTANTRSQTSVGPTGLQLSINSYSNGATVVMYITQGHF